MTIPRRVDDGMELAASEILRMNLVQAPRVLAVSGTTARTALLPVGVYRVYAEVKCYMRQGGSAVTAAVTDSPVSAEKPIRVLVTGTADGYLAGITSSGSGNVFITELV